MLAVLSNINLEPISSFMDVSYFGIYDQVVSELENSNGFCQSEKCSKIWIHIDAQEFLKDLLYQSEAKDKAIELLNLTLGAVQRFSLRFPLKKITLSTFSLPPFKIHSFLDIPTSPEQGAFEQELNSRLYTLSKDLSNLSLLPSNLVFHEIGFQKAFAPNFWYLGRIKYSQLALKSLSKQYSNLQAAQKNQSKKVLILDLDQTLWGKVLGEAGIEGITLSSEGVGKAYQDFQKLIKYLKNLGVILALCSKNNEKDVKEVFSDHPDMILKWEDFACIKVNWQPKHENIASIAQDLDLSLNSLVFIDDNPVERELIKSSLEEVSVPEFPKCPTLLKDWFLKEVIYSHFPKAHLTTEDRKKNQLYKQKTERLDFKSNYSFKDFLKALEIKLEVRHNPLDLTSRLSQLSQKTNQFNLTLKRQEEFEIKNSIQDPSFQVFSANYVDKFGSEGIIGLLIFKISGEIATIDNFLLSCRVIGREVETAFFREAILYLKSDNIKMIKGEFIQGKRNHLLKGLLEKLGLKPTEDSFYKENINKLLSFNKTTFIQINQKKILELSKG
ncbi:Uncharacterized protein AB751O23_BI_00030 [Chlamydiales bacterium SCGC AB-751-O23]|jgi:FkbH-like protein|nr:Uncharacterized protein AB751O23_BI_00030 [Chlamydiales bacterium SCGC AB-751-O23]